MTIQQVEQEQKQALEGYRFHKQNGDKYGLAQWFNGQRALIRKLKRKIKQP